jgi:UDP-N-acetylglucosamine 2-epimerase (non-hydrolysing)
MVEQFGFGRYCSTTPKPEGLWITEPLGYLELLHLNMQATMVVTDSGGLQEETTVLGVPCITLRHNTERPITCEVGTNFVVGNRPDDIRRQAMRVLDGDVVHARVPEKWDGRAAERIVDVFIGVDSMTYPGSVAAISN